MPNLTRRKFLQLSIPTLAITLLSKIHRWQPAEPLVHAVEDGFGFGAYGEGEYPAYLNTYLPFITLEDK